MVVVGSFAGSVDFGGDLVTYEGGRDLFVAKYAGSTGAHVWSRRAGYVNFDEAFGVAVDSHGDVLVTGYFEQLANLGGGALLAVGGSRDIFLVKYAGVDGQHVWSQSMGGPYVDEGRAVAVDEDDNVVVTGVFQYTADFAGQALVGGGDEAFVAKFSPAGALQWVKTSGGTGNESGEAIAVDGSGNVVVAGSFACRMDFGGGPLSSLSSSPDIYLLTLAP